MRSRNQRPRLNRRKLAEALRAYIAEIVACDAPDEAFAAAADAFEGFTTALVEHPRRPRTPERGATDGVETSEFCPVSGASNPLAPPLKVLASHGDVVTGVVSFPASFEGPPGLVHGGYVATVLEELLGRAQTLAGQPGTRGTVFVRFRSPCPLNTALQLEARISRVEARTMLTKATMHAGDQLVAEAQGAAQADR